MVNFTIFFYSHHVPKSGVLVGLPKSLNHSSTTTTSWNCENKVIQKKLTKSTVIESTVGINACPPPPSPSPTSLLPSPLQLTPRHNDLWVSYLPSKFKIKIQDRLMSRDRLEGLLFHFWDNPIVPEPVYRHMGGLIRVGFC